MFRRSFEQRQVQSWQLLASAGREMKAGSKQQFELQKLGLNGSALI